MDFTLEEHLEEVVEALGAGALVPLLGAGVNLSDRADGEAWTRGENLPSASELAKYLAGKLRYPEPQTAGDLQRVSQYVQARRGDGTLFRYLHEVFSERYVPTRLHGFLATLPARLELATGRRRYQLIVTTNYDDALEQAFAAAGERCDVVWYERPVGPECSGRARCVHRTHEGATHHIERANEYAGLSLDDRSVILKVHGAVDRAAATALQDSYVISEDHYIEYLSDTRLNDLFPVTLLGTLFTSHFLFLGYRLVDWNVRVILHQIWHQRGRDLDAWAIQRQVRAIDRVLWETRGVHLLDEPLKDYVDALDRHLPPPDGTRGERAA